MIPFNKPTFSGKELQYIQEAIGANKFAGDGTFTKRCYEIFEKKFGFKKSLLTTSCTDALEMSAILLDLKPGDEVIVPSYTFVSTANAFALRGAKIIFADSEAAHPNIDPAQLESLITKKTRAIVVVHYAGVACDMDKLKELARLHGLSIIEDAAQAIDSYYKGMPLGSLGRHGAFSFHDTKNITSGEGGLLVLNDPQDYKRAEIVREKGTNRSAFFRGEVDKYTWVDIGSSFLLSDLLAAFLYAQLEDLASIQARRRRVWDRYQESLIPLMHKHGLQVPVIPDYATNNAHMFYLLCRSAEEHAKLLAYMRDRKIGALSHYLPLHLSHYYSSQRDGRDLVNAVRFAESLIRLPLYVSLEENEISEVIEAVEHFYSKVI